MKNTENPSYPNNSVELYNMKDVFNSLVQSKILVLVMAAIFSTLISYYLISTQEKPKYRSSAVVEIGKYTNLEDEVQFFERRDDIQENMNSIFIQRLVNDNTKENFASLIKRFGNDLLIFETTAPSKQKSLKSINEMITYIVDSQAKISEEKQRKLINELDSEYFGYVNDLAKLKLEEDEIINIDLPSVDNKRNEELALFQQRIDRINEISLPSVENEMNAELASIKRQIKDINEIFFPSIDNEQNLEIATILRKIQYLSSDGNVFSDSLSKDVRTIFPVNNVNKKISDNTLFYIESLNDEQKIFELENFNDELLYVVASKKIEKLKLQSQIKGFNKLLEFTKVNSVGEQLKLQSIRDELTNSIANIVSIENIDIERLNNSLEIIKLSENIIKKQMQDNEAKKIFFLEPLNYISPSLKGQIVTSEIRGNSKPKLILNAIILSFFLSIILLIFITILRENIEFTKN